MSDTPIWQPDSDASSCVLCDTQFTLFNRRHHCRKCGRIVCASCSAQHINYFPNSRVLLPDNTLVRAIPQDHYRTCDECVEEVRMIRRALFESPISEALPSASHARSPDLEDTPEFERHSGASITKYASRVGTAAMDLTSTLDTRNGDTDSDDNLCPVCGVDLLKLYVSEVKLKRRESSHSDYEAFKESHISECLVAFDFANDHNRLGSPPGASSTRNRMLVYNIPPFPKPSYEIIDVHQSTSVDTLPQLDTACGLVTSNSTVQLEKDVTDLECVICLEELRPGDKVGRLECLCVFHYKCIKDWFNKKGYGECPVHFLHH
ncbi:CIC11C00000003755 [Sungouiella intermedia]|uniref:RING-type E3 ubiquitin transferase n=1 Tax=Sungouiella intermedia TaxID=45354 RepID=A0A1L0D861_9ASCO|nr:CIC11C00000003755 [[Candida] intermedia]